jgi:hypothetical protein
MASSGPGACGHRQCTTNKKISAAAASPIVAGRPVPNWRVNELSWLKNSSPVTGTPVTRLS